MLQCGITYVLSESHRNALFCAYKLKSLHTQCIVQLLICGRIWGKRPYRTKHDFWLFFKLSPFQGNKSPRLPTWCVDSVGLLLHRSNVRSWSKPPVLNGELPKWGLNGDFEHDRLAHSPAQTGSRCGTEFLASLAGWIENHYTKVEVCCCYAISV